MELTALALNAQRVKVAQITAIRDAAVDSIITLIDSGVTIMTHSANILVETCYHLEKETRVLKEMQNEFYVNEFPEKR